MGDADRGRECYRSRQDKGRGGKGRTPQKGGGTRIPQKGATLKMKFFVPSRTGPLKNGAFHWLPGVRPMNGRKVGLKGMRKQLRLTKP